MQPTDRGRAITVGVLIVAGIANIAGYTANLYQRWWWFDRVLHPGTIFAISLALGLFVFAKAFRPAHPVLIALLIASIGLAIGGLWEVAEWAFDRLASGDNIKGKYDTILDLITDTVGAVSAGFISLALLEPIRTADAGDRAERARGAGIP